MKRICTLLTVTALIGSVSADIHIKQPDGTYYKVGLTSSDYLKYSRHMRVPFTSQQGATWDAGNNVAGKTGEEIVAIVDAIKLLETNAKQKEIFDRLKSSTESNFLENVDHAKGIVKQRLETCSKMEFFNDFFTFKYAKPNLSNDAGTTANLWERGKRRTFYFRQKGGTAYQAISQLCSPGISTEGECWGAFLACVWWGASQGMGEAAFNVLYPGNDALDMDPHPKHNKSCFKNLYRGTDTSTIIPGDYVYFKNDNYQAVINHQPFKKLGWINKKKNHLWSGENGFYIGNQKYEGLGAADKTKLEMQTELATWYNNHLVNVINNGGKIDGVLVKAIDLNDAGDIKARVKIIRVRRVSHDR